MISHPPMYFEGAAFSDGPWREQLRKGIWPRSLLFWMLAFYMSLVIIRPWELLFPQLANYAIERIYVILMVTACVLGGRAQVHLNLQTFAVTMFMTALAISSICAQDFNRSYNEFYRFLIIAASYFLITSIIQTPRELIMLVICYLAIMGAYLGKSEWEYFVNGHFTYRQGLPRMNGIDSEFGSANAFGASAVFAIPFVVFCLRTQATISASWPRIWRRALKPALILLSIMIVVAVIYSRSRAGAVCCAAALVLSVAGGNSLWKRVRNFAGLVLLGMIVFSTLSDGARERLESIWDRTKGPGSAQASVHGRSAALEAAMSLFAQFPLTGVGMGNFGNARQSFVDGDKLKAHNLYGQVAAEAGIVGICGFGLLVCVILLNCRRIRRLGARLSSVTSGQMDQLALACRNIVLLMLLSGMTGHNLSRPQWMWMAAFSSLAYKFQQQLAVRSNH